MKRNSAIIGPQKLPALWTGSSGLFDLHDQYIEKRNDTWPYTPKYLSCTESTSTVTEGNSMTFTVTTEGLADGTTLYYTVNTLSGTTMDADDFDGTSIATSFTHDSNQTVLTFNMTAEDDPGDAESNTFKLEIRTGSTSGTVVVESGTVTVTDAISYGVDIRSSFYEISNRIIVDSSGADYTGAYDVSEVQQNYSGTAAMYIALKCTTSTTYVNDICIAAVQVLNSADVVQVTYNWSTGNPSWYTTYTPTGGITGTQGQLFSALKTPNDAALMSYSVISTSNVNSTISAASGTGSSYTGMADGINSTTPTLTVGNGTVAQSTGAYYIYRETSGAARYTTCIARSPSRTWSTGDKIRVVHAVTTSSAMSSTLDIDDSIWIGIY